MMGGLTLRYFPPTTPLPWELAFDRRGGDEVGPKHQTAFPQLLTQTPPTPHKHPPLPVSPPSVARLFIQGQSSGESSPFEKQGEINLNIWWWILSPCEIASRKCDKHTGSLASPVQAGRKLAWIGREEHLNI